MNRSYCQAIIQSLGGLRKYIPPRLPGLLSQHGFVALSMARPPTRGLLVSVVTGPGNKPDDIQHVLERSDVSQHNIRPKQSLDHKRWDQSPYMGTLRASETSLL